MKLNWGHYIVIGFVSFVALILFMVVRSFQHTNDLVSEDYYAQELLFQDVIDKKTAASKLSQDIIWKSENRGILVTYPEMPEQISGEILLFRPSDKNRDRTFKIELDSLNPQFLKDESFVHGKYLIKIDWTSGGKLYFTEGTAYVIQ